MLSWPSSLTQQKFEKLAVAALRLLQGIQSQLTSALDWWIFSEDDAHGILHSLNSVEQTVVAEASSRLINVVHTKFPDSTKLLTTALKLDKIVMQSVICMASDALSEEATTDAKNTINLFRDFMHMPLQEDTDMDQAFADIWWCIRNRTSARVLIRTRDSQRQEDPEAAWLQRDTDNYVLTRRSLPFPGRLQGDHQPAKLEGTIRHHLRW